MLTSKLHNLLSPSGVGSPDEELLWRGAGGFGPRGAVHRHEPAHQGVIQGGGGPGSHGEASGGARGLLARLGE